MLRFRAFGSFACSDLSRPLPRAEHFTRLAAESGWYDGDPEGLLGQLNDELFQARRLVVDTGLHAKHWTRQQPSIMELNPAKSSARSCIQGRLVRTSMTQGYDVPRQPYV
jgi:hypothetical protein